MDFCQAIDWIITRDDWAGPVNVASPGPIPNWEMMRILRKATGVSFGLPGTAWMLEVGAFFLKTETELILKSRRVAPGGLMASGLQFQFPSFAGAVQDLIAHHSAKQAVPDKTARSNIGVL